jgi:hypothetical protein
MAPIESAPSKMKSRVKLSSQAVSDVGYIEDDFDGMERAGVFSAVGSAAELKKLKNDISQQEILQKKATEGRAGGKLTIEDMMHRPKKQLISRKMENDIADFPKSSGASRAILDP